MQLQAGVTIRGVQGIRSGGARKQDHAHMTRAEFKVFAARKAAARSTAGLSVWGKKGADTHAGEAPPAELPSRHTRSTEHVVAEPP